MDSDGPTSNVGRTLWAAWYYITGAISRFFRSEAVNNVANDPNSFQESAVDNESAACGHTEEEASKKEAEEEHPLTILKVRSSPQVVVGWEHHCPSESHGEPDVMDTPYKTQLTDIQDKASLKGDDAREGGLSQTGWDVELFNAQDNQQKGKRIQSLHTDGQGEMQDYGDCLNSRSLHSKEDTGAEEAAARALTKGDWQRMDNMSIRIKTTDGEDDKADLENEDCDIRQSLRQEEEDREGKGAQQDEDLGFLASEFEGESNLGAKQVINPLSVISQSADDKLHPENGNLPKGEVVIVGKQDNATNLTDIQSKDVKREDTDVISDRLIHEIQAGEEKLYCGREDEDCYQEASRTSAWVTVDSINNIGQEASGEFKNILQGTCEGQLVVSQGLNPPLSEEVQRGFPASNNEQGQDENTIQRFLEERDPEECKTALLPQETEGKQSVQKNCPRTGSDNLLTMECMEEEQKTGDDIQESFDLAEEDRCGILHLTDDESPQGKEPLAESVMQAVLLDSVGAGIKHQEEETQATSKELQGETEELLVELEINDASKVYASEGDQKIQEVVVFTDENVNFFEDKMLEMAEMGNRSQSLLDDFNESGLVRQEAERESTFLEGKTAEIQDAGLKMEISGLKDDGTLANNESKGRNEEVLNLAIESMSELSTDSGNILDVESEGLVTQKQPSQAINNDTVSKSTAKDMTVISAEETQKRVTMIYIEETSPNSAQEVIDEETIDPWIQMSSQDTDSVKGQKESEPGLQMDWKIDPVNAEEEDEISSDPPENEEQFVEPSQSGGSEFRSHTEMSSCTEGADFLDHAPSGSGAQRMESQLWTLNITGSLEGTTTTSESDACNIFVPGPKTGSLDTVTEEPAEVQQSHPGEAGHLNQESVESQGKFKQESGSECDVGVTDHTGETEEDIQSSTEMDTFVQAPKENEDTLKDTVAVSGDEKENLGSGPCRSPSEMSLEMSGSTACGSQGDPESARLIKLSTTETPQTGWSEDDVDTLLGLNRTQGSRHQMEVHESLLDSSPQKSRISIKNPRVRPPKDARSLIQMPSLNPTPSSPSPSRTPVGFPGRGLGIGIKLPGLTGGLPILKKTQTKEVEPKPESKNDAPEEDEGQRKPKWMPPRQPGFGNPLMSELKTKLKKTTRDNEL
ncbi:uncharacterized protein [Takifugu rubripes]|uniref:uncharacterized protein n=1 Tax=Takifugu rubripes TaxID=31033 RepID=UPI0011458479|nr:uncharacterized protein LOC105416308 [Takifugu rubripes]